MPRKVVVFSGGYDSTLALAEVVIAANPDEDEVIALSFVHHSTGDAKLVREHEARVLILKELRDHFPQVKLRQMEVDIRIPWDLGSGANSKGLSQPIFWICNTIPLLKEKDIVYLGYIQSDQAMTHLDDIRSMWQHALAIQEYKLVELKLPNKMASKAEVLTALMRGYPYLVDFCTSCESLGMLDGHERCGQCTPCRHMIEALMGIAATDTHEAQKAQQMLMDLYHIRVDIHRIHEDARCEAISEPMEYSIDPAEKRPAKEEWED